MKKVLSILLSVAMLMGAMFIVPTSAELADKVSFLNQEWLAEGAENVTVNEDGSWTVTGPFALAPNFTFDYTVHEFISLDMTVGTPVKITLLDRDPEGVYGDHWIGLFDNWDGRMYFPVGEYTETNSILGIYNWNTNPEKVNPPWGNTGLATARAIFFEFEGGGAGELTIRDFNLNNGHVTKFFAEEPMFETTEVFDLADKDVDMWEQIPVNGSRVTIAVDEASNALVLGNTKGYWPSTYIDFAEPVVAAPDTAMIYADFTVEKSAKTTLYVFFGESTATEFAVGSYAIAHDIYGAEVGPATYKGYINVADILPVDEAARAACFDENGNLVVTAIKLFSTTDGDVIAPETALEKTVTINALDLMYNVPEIPEEPSFMLGDVDGNGKVNLTDAFAVYRAASTGNVPENVLAYADTNGDGKINLTDAFRVYAIASGK